MKRIHLVLLYFCTPVLLTACAPYTIPRSVTQFQILQAKERAGLYPGDWRVSGDSHSQQFARLQAWAGEQGIVVALAPLADKNLLGHTSHARFTGWIVLINERLPANNRLYTLVHELAHVYSPDKLNAAEAEVIAEMVSATVCEHFGLDVWPQTAAYLVTFVTLDRQTATVFRYGAQIDQMVERFTKAGQP